MAELRFETVYEAYASMVYWVAFGVLNNHDSALELTQHVFLKAYECWDQFRAMVPPQAKGWLYKAARNAAIDRLRKEKREIMWETLPDQTDADCAAQPEHAALLREGRAEILRLVRQLPDIYREPVLLHYFGLLSQKEAAEALRITGGTYRSRLSRAKAMLAEKLREEGVQHEAT